MKKKRILLIIILFCLAGFKLVADKVQTVEINKHGSLSKEDPYEFNITVEGDSR